MVIWTPGMTLETLERLVIEKAYVHFNKNKSAVARSLGVSVRTIDTKFEKYAEDDKRHLEAEEVLRQQEQEYLRRARGDAPNQYHTADGPRSMLGRSPADDALDLTDMPVLPSPGPMEVSKAAAGQDSSQQKMTIKLKK